jgi:membrane associated rhomboid family serine protease
MLNLNLICIVFHPFCQIAEIYMITILIILVTVLFSVRGFSDHGFLDRHVFEVEKVLVFKEYRRLITSGFVHLSWMHLFFNMLSLYLFSGGLEQYLGGISFLLIYFTSLVGGNLLALYIHRHHSSYSAVGASGAVNGVIFATIALFPSMRIGFFPLPLSIPAWLYGLLYVGYSMYGIRSRRENVGHEAHLGGALIGMLVAILMVPQALIQNYLPILAILLPTSLFIFLIIYRPDVLLVDNLFYRRNRNYTVEDRYNAGKAKEQLDIDKILEKIHKKGIKSLTKREKEALEEYSKQVK